MLRDVLLKKAQSILEKNAFQPMPNGAPPADPAAAGAPPMDPAMAGGAPAGAPPMDPAMMGGAPAGAPPMDPAMMGGMPMDPSMMGGMPPGMSMGAPMPATVGQLSITDFQTMMTDMLTIVLQQMMQSGMGAMGGAGAPPGGEVPPEQAMMEDKKPVSNTEISEKLDAMIALLSGAAAPGGMPPAGGADMGFGGQSAQLPPPESMMPPSSAMGGTPEGAPGAGGMEIQAGVRPSKRNSLASLIINKVAKAKGGR